METLVANVANPDGALIVSFVLGVGAGFVLFRAAVIGAVRHLFDDLIADMTRYAILAGEPDEETRQKAARYREEMKRHGF